MSDIKRVEMRYSKRAAFSAFELLCIIVIIAIMASVGIRYLGYITSKQCLLHLKARLTHTQNALSAYYTDTFIRAESIDITYPQRILSYLSQTNTPQCGFNIQSHQIIATIGTQSLAFSLEPPTLEVNPKISCNLSTPLCKDFSDRILDK